MELELIQRYDAQIARIAADFGLDTYPNQVEIISAEQMMDAYSSVGMPVGYHHWSYGKQVPLGGAELPPGSYGTGL